MTQLLRNRVERMKTKVSQFRALSYPFAEQAQSLLEVSEKALGQYVGPRTTLSPSNVFLKKLTPIRSQVINNLGIDRSIVNHGSVIEMKQHVLERLKDRSSTANQDDLLRGAMFFLIAPTIARNHLKRNAAAVDLLQLTHRLLLRLDEALGQTDRDKLVAHIEETLLALYHIVAGDQPNGSSNYPYAFGTRMLHHLEADPHADLIRTSLREASSRWKKASSYDAIKLLEANLTALTSPDAPVLTVAPPKAH